MITTKASVPMLLLLCVLLCSGCTTTKYVVKPCETPIPKKSELPVCGAVKGDMAFAECARTNYLVIQKDYDVLLENFKSCK